MSFYDRLNGVFSSDLLIWWGDGMSEGDRLVISPKPSPTHTPTVGSAVQYNNGLEITREWEIK